MPLILDHSYLVGKLTGLKIAHTSVRILKVLKLLFQQFSNLSSFHQGISGPILGALSNNRWSGGTISVTHYKTSLWRITRAHGKRIPRRRFRRSCELCGELTRCRRRNPVFSFQENTDDYCLFKANDWSRRSLRSYRLCVWQRQLRTQHQLDCQWLAQRISPTENFCRRSAECIWLRQFCYLHALARSGLPA